MHTDTDTADPFNEIPNEVRVILAQDSCTTAIDSESLKDIGIVLLKFLACYEELNAITDMHKQQSVLEIVTAIQESGMHTWGTDELLKSLRGVTRTAIQDQLHFYFAVSYVLRYRAEQYLNALQQTTDVA
ncbi:MAG: hypothetical protein LR017_03545 [Candidatus Pacebacteria bacterium]|nr:hypothetical protein [Candidatus Paceibacterota bacterium]